MRSRLKATSLLATLVWAAGGCATTQSDPGCFEAAVTVPPVEMVDPAMLLEQLRGTPRTNPERFERLRELFAAAGCGPLLTEQVVPKARQPNLVCTLPGAGDTRIVVGAHFDKVSAGRGVVDNWSGAVLLPALYQGLSRANPRNTFAFVAFTGEERGQLGSKAFVELLIESGDANTIVAMINLDTLGLGDTKFEAHEADKQLACLLAATAGRIGEPVKTRGNGPADSSDHEPFRDADIPAIRLHSLTRSSTSVIHSGADRFEAVDPTAYRASYRLIAAYLAAVDQFYTVPE